MSTLTVIPTDAQSPWYSQVITLANVRYTLTLRFNTRMSRWLLDVGDAADKALVLGVPLLINRNLLRQYPGRGLPPGAMFVTDESGAEQQPSLSSFLRTHVLWYLEPDL